MGGALIKNVVIALILVVMAFIVGSLAADGAKESLGVIAACVGIFVLLYMGKNCWWLIFLLPPVLDQFGAGSIFGKLPVSYIICGVILVYWLIMRMMGYVKVTWQGVWWMDLMTLVVLGYFALTYYWHPVSVRVLGIETEYMGGATYVWCLAGILAYCALSIIPCTLQELGKVLRYAFFFSLVTCIYNTIHGYSGYSAMIEGASNDRFTLFTAVGQILFQWMVCKYSILGIVTSLWKVTALCTALFAIILCGFRESLIWICCFFLFVSVVKRQLTLLACLLACSYALLLYLSSEEVLVHAPYGVQRVLSIVPGVKVDPAIKKNAQGSSDWRIVMWKWALDPRTRYIKDYIWGDGFGISTYWFKLTTININRGRSQFASQEMFAENGTWHNGFISIMHRVGLVGWGLMFLWWSLATFLVLRTCYGLRKRPEQLYIMYTTMYLPVRFIWAHVSAGSSTVFFQAFYYVAITKVAYCEALKAGIMAPLFTKEHYVPLVVQDMARSGEKLPHPDSMTLSKCREKGN